MSTDREKIKAQQEGVYLTTPTTSKEAVAAMHSRGFNHRKMGTENAATNVSALPMGFVPHRSRGAKFAIQTVTNIAADNSHYLIVRFYGRKNGTSTLIGSWNTHGGAQGALTTAGPSVVSTAATGLVTNADAIVAADSEVMYDIGKVGNGQDLPAGSILSAWLEEI